ncbi:beta-lactamase, partial [Pseudogymnoascus sp. 03VT05]
MAPLDEQFQQACDARDLPGVVLLASDTTGKFKYEKAFGMKSPGEKIDINATFILASCTKLMTAIAAMQCVERGEIQLDDDVSTVLTELKNIQILTGFNEETNEPTFTPAKNKITLRTSPPLQRITSPLLFEPGTSWEYGTGLDWAGFLVMRLTGTSLEAYMQSHIWDPLGIRNITFHQELKPEVRKRLVTMTKRGARKKVWSKPSTAGEAVIWTDDKLYEDPCAHEFGGGGAIGSAREYLKILTSICASDGKLLKGTTIDEMFTPQLAPGPQRALTLYNAALAETETFTSRKAGTKLNFGLGGLLVLSDDETGLKAGTMTWSGLPNLLWTVDRRSGLSAFYAGNVIPFGDFRSHVMQQLFEREVYGLAAAAAAAA